MTRNELRDDPVGSILGPSVKDKSQQFEDAHFFSLLSVKRKAFTFESEIRFFIVGDIKFDEKGLAPIGMDLRQVIQKVMVEPKDPKFLSQVERQNYEKLNNENDEFYKKKFHPLGIRTVRSTLYSEVPSNILIK